MISLTKMNNNIKRDQRNQSNATTKVYCITFYKAQWCFIINSSLWRHFYNKQKKLRNTMLFIS